MCYEPNQISGTFFRDGENLTGIICSPAISGRLQFAPEGTPDGRLIGRMNGQVVGHAYPAPESPSHAAYTVHLDPAIFPGAGNLALVPRAAVYLLMTAQ